MIDPQSLGARVLEAIRANRAARPARLAAARGALPLTPAELAQIQILLAVDPDPEIAEAAAASLDAVPPATAALLASDADASPDVLAFLAAAPERWPEIAPLLAGSARVPAAALRTIAASPLPDALARLVLNERALAEDEELGQLLSENAALRSSDRLRLLDYLDELAKRDARRAPAADDGASIDEILAAPAAPARDPFLAALGIDAEVEQLLPVLGLDLGQLQDRSELLGVEAGDAENILVRLARMNVGQKLKVALFGNRETRLLLIRDSNRIVSAAVVKNPKFTQQEAETAANSRNVTDEVLRLVARHRDFSKVYGVQHALVKNPRCPVDLALPLVGGLNDHDMRLLLKNRNVSEAVRRQAKKIMETREARRRVRLGPGKH